MRRATSDSVFWDRYVAQLPADHRHRSIKPDAFAFGGSGSLADELAQLVLSGRKRATTSLAVEFTSMNEALPRVGDVSIILDGGHKPVAIIERTAVETLPFESVVASYAAVEGEGDGSLTYWRSAHIEYFEGVCRKLGGSFTSKTPVICQRFRLVWPANP
ncbi:MAG: ASCH domain-containing protein [Burkholderiales bacterium]